MRGAVAQGRTLDNGAPLSVGELSAALKRQVEGAFGHVRVRGEVSGFKRPASGHLYFALKDADAVLDAVMWRGSAGRIGFAMEDGVDVIATGRLTTYPGRSKYQIVVENVELAGEGALLALLEKTKARLATEGLFASERKQSIPFLPRTIGVVTSPTGAVIRDILHRLADRMPTHVLVWPVLVQGQGAAEQIAAAIRGFDALPADGPVPRPDLVIVARGGGSIEDLWAFNEEIVVRAAADCRIPLISAVGHETDTTLIDYAADLRAPTPTAAAEQAVPVRQLLADDLTDLSLRGARAMRRLTSENAVRLDEWGQRLPTLDRLLAPQRQALDDGAARLQQAFRLRLAEGHRALAAVSGALSPALVANQLRGMRDRLDAQWRLLGALDPRQLLSRGYAMVRDLNGRIVPSAQAASAARNVELVFADGAVAAWTGDAPPPRPPRPAASPKKQPSKPSSKPHPKPTPTSQGDLFG
ncbi:MAG: exodeoxyribonuclease VII large subunit [Sphingomonadaceae bacterium]|nr:exodeoxyribonuclease VII large subunit [Sphingomonadaceae bacterium]